MGGKNYFTKKFGVKLGSEKKLRKCFDVALIDCNYDVIRMISFLLFLSSETLTRLCLVNPAICVPYPGFKEMAPLTPGEAANSVNDSQNCTSPNRTIGFILSPQLRGVTHQNEQKTVQPCTDYCAANCQRPSPHKNIFAPSPHFFS